ncbi:MAG: CPBP family intramembrane metalloprotease [Anaerolineae bacterium]|uniref:CPBP family glutamic-type intramembrane protease n=1 Tax=Promineifilum sp. TaxID=2664178 RepID=UPI001DA6D2F3|nr:CPBP family intramembrane metalloprotease [Anaerolineales bacterium]MCO5180665.1 CPBP family glutamic-type intramembrane protease [Promineifilum sp.]MCW5847774.1 CPBP family intramembrane metalloprotease [Anaerolineae bacterium]
MTINMGALAGFLTLFVIYQIAEANGLDILHIPRKPLSTFLLFIGVIIAAAIVAYGQGANGLAAYGLDAGGWLYYPLGVLLGVAVQGVMEGVGLLLGIRKVSDFRLSLTRLAGGFIFILFANFPAAAAEDLITRGYPFRYLQSTPVVAFMIFSSFLYVTNHILRLATKPVTDWYHLPFTGLTLAYALAQTHSLWFVIGLHQSGNVIYYLMRQMMNVENTTNVRRRIAYGIASELVFLAVVMLVVH